MKKNLCSGAAPRAWCRLLVPLVGIGLLAGCYPGEIENVSELDTVATLYDDVYWEQNDGKNHTYDMPDSVFHLCEILDDPPADCIDLSRAFDDQMISLVRTNMADLGYVPFDSTVTDTPDVRMAILAIGTESYDYYVWYPGWNPYYPGWGWYYPPSWGSVRYETGTIFIPMAPGGDEGLGSGDSGLTVVWSAAINGLLGTSGQETQNRLNRNINQAFTQSQYLKSRGGSQ